MIELKRLPPGSVDLALEKADHYRELNQPEEAESICRDVLEIAPGNAKALKLLGLALTDRFPNSWSTVLDEALETFNRLESAYERMYYTGIVHERCAKAQLEHGQAHNALVSFEAALECFEKCEPLAPTGSPEPVLRWNRCVRMLTQHPELLAAQTRARGSLHSVLGD